MATTYSAEMIAAGPAARCLAEISGRCERRHGHGGSLSFLRGGRPVLHAGLLVPTPSMLRVSSLLSVERGGGRHAMGVILECADRHQVEVTLTAASFVPARMTTEELVDWYARLGFVVEEDYGIWPRAVDMRRPPSGPESRNGAPSAVAASASLVPCCGSGQHSAHGP